MLSNVIINMQGFFQPTKINWNILSINHVISFQKNLKLIQSRKNFQIKFPHLLFYSQNLYQP